MCGIVGVLGKHEVAPLMVEALKRLEYRGYDSAGIATIDSDRRLARRRAVGKLVNLSDLLVHQPLAGKSGIGHTRWATHGAPNETNAHPHRVGRVAVVHNGIAYLAGQVGAEGASVTAQTEAVLASVDRLLAAAGTDKTKLLTAQIWVADIADFAEMNAVWDAWVAPGHAPARWTGEAKLATPGFKVEVIVTAAV